jgi:hypothetical protein
MSRSKDKHRAKLKEIYGVNFPDALFWLHEFIIEQCDCDDPIDLGDIGLYPCGVLSLLLNFDDLGSVKFRDDPLLHYRYYRDIPEFFTYLNGDTDGQHWGMLLDEPADGFRGAAMYWSNDGAEMTVYDGVFDALIIECEESIARLTEYIIYNNQASKEEDSEEKTAYSKQQLKLYQELKNRLTKFLEINQLSRHEGRAIGLETSTGIDIVLKDDFDCDYGEAIEMLRVGRELWYWDGKDRSAEAFDLMSRAYKLLARHELIRILETHFHNRSRLSVDSIQQ